MSSPPHFYASRPSSRQASRPTSPPTSAELRTQAIAKLKRAASLPRTPAGRRPAQTAENNNNSITYGDDRETMRHTEAVSGYGGEEEMLSASPDGNTNSFVSPVVMQRSVSASSSFYIPTPPLNRTYDASSSPSHYYIAPAASTAPDWAAMQLAHSYLPSLSPVANAYLPHPISGPGRSTPSPLPSLGELRSLQRSNSAAARAKAMTKLTGKETPLPEQDSPSRPVLQRADSLGAARMLDAAILKPGRAPTPDAEPTQMRPRLQRSFTVSSSNMGEERRSAVGRRMVERLAKSKAAREAEEAEVRRMWEERVGVKVALQGEDGQNDDEELDGHVGDEREDEHLAPYEDHEEHAIGEDDTDHHYAPPIPRLERHSPVEPAQVSPNANLESTHLPVPERTPSRNTFQSADEAFEYESHLRRSLSSRTARQELAETTAPKAASQYPMEDSDGQEIVPLAPPLPPFATPTKHAQHASTSTQGTIHPSQETSPSSSMSRDGLQSMMFVMGGDNAPTDKAARDGSWPMEVGDAGSEWGTPAKHHDETLNDANIVNSPVVETHMPSHTSNDSLQRTLTRPESDMSWEEVGGMADREVPSDPKYHGRKDSVSAKIKRTVETAMKKQGQRRSSLESSTSYSRRGSESSTSPSHLQPSRSISRGQDQVSHQPSLNSLSPSLQPESSANSILLQHQLSSESSPVSLIPRADPNDPRIHSSKMSPFPGIIQLERRGSNLDEPPRLLQQTSDSTVPSVSRVLPVSGEVHNIPLNGDGSRRESEESVTKKGWLAKTFGPSPRSSTSVSRKSSIPDISDRKYPSPPSTASSNVDADPFAGPSLPPQVVKTKQRGLSASPSVSIVQEASDEGSRLTRFTQAPSANPVIEEEQNDDENMIGLGVILPARSLQVLERMDEVLALESDDPARPEMLDDPPRKLLLATQVLQVVNAHTVKDRYLFLFNDILVIAKPLIITGIHANLDTRFIVKSVVSLDKLLVSGLAPENSQPTNRHPVVQNFIDRFAADPIEAVRYLVERSNPKVDPVTLASLIFKTPELDKAQIGMLLAHNVGLLEAFVDRFHFTGIKIEEALRMFLLSIRLPADVAMSEVLLRGFADRYFDANHDKLQFDRETTSDLVLSIMQLEDSLYSTFGKFAFENREMGLDEFISVFESDHPRSLISQNILGDIFWSIKQNRLGQALSPQESETLSRVVEVMPAKLPTKLTYDIWSEPITLSISEVDRDFKIRLVGEGMEFDPRILDFGKAKHQPFRVKSKILGIRSILFDRIGANAPLYASLGSARQFMVERSFMQHTFQVTFISHLGLKRKYCFSVPDSQTREKWATAVQRQIRSTLAVKTRAIPIGHASKVQQAAENVALQVLRDALIPPDEKNDLPTSTSYSGQGVASSKGSFGAGVSTSAATAGSKKSTPMSRGNRKGSISVAYGSNVDGTGTGNGKGNNGEEEDRERDYENERQAGLLGHAQTGKELVLLCRQNSLLPSLLQLLQAGVVESNGGRTVVGSLNGLHVEGQKRAVGGRV